MSRAPFVVSAVIILAVTFAAALAMTSLADGSVTRFDLVFSAAFATVLTLVGYGLGFLALEVMKR